MQSSARRLLPICGWIVLFAPLSAAAQVSGDGEVEVITREDVGHFRPQQEADLEKTAELIVQRTNQFRDEWDLEAVDASEPLRQAAREFADYMARTGRYGHTADGRTPSERIAAHDYEYCVTAENIAYQFRTTGFETERLSGEFVQNWIDSPGHRENMLNPAVTETGVAVAQSEETGAYFAVQLFARPRAAAIEFAVSNRTDETVEYRFADRSYSLPPRYVRRHLACIPGEMHLLREEESVQTVTPADGQTLHITGGEGRARIETAED